MASLWRTFLQSSSTSASAVEADVNGNVNVNKHDDDDDDDDEAYYRSGGCQVSKRHLRRRTGSHNRKKRHRFPTGSNTGSSVGVDGDGDGHGELSSNTCSTGGDDDDDDDGGDGDCGDGEEKSRRARRKPRLLKAKHAQWQTLDNSSRAAAAAAAAEVETEEISKDATSSTAVAAVLPQSNPSSNWLETHLWHSKRFCMSPPLAIYNHWCIPLGHSNRGSRAGLRLAQTKSTIQDATWTLGGRAIVIDATDRDALLDIVERICGGSRMHSAPFLREERVVRGWEVGYGLVHDLDLASFPGGVVGPASFLFGDNAKGCFVRIGVEGSIWNRVERIIRDIVLEFRREGGVECAYSGDATTLIRVRGLQATQVIVQSLKLKIHAHGAHAQSGNGGVALLDWDSRLSVSTTSSDLHTSLRHGTAIRVRFDGVHTQLSRNGDDLQEQQQQQSTSGSILEHVDVVQGQAIEEERSVLNVPHLQENELILISQAPNPVDNGTLSQNSAVSGWDILCPPALTSAIFTALNNTGGACAIGFIEHSCCNMEAEPPLPVWPRDFPDTDTGADYWSSENNEWKMMRYCIEEGLAGGRIKTVLNRLLKKCTDKDSEDGEDKITKIHSVSQKLSQPSIDWSGLESGSSSGETDDGESKPIVVVRSGFTAPFVQALNGFGQHYFNHAIVSPGDATGKQKGRRRPRRKVRGRDDTIMLPPVEEHLLAVQQQGCSSLLNSLSIPALMRCHLTVEGKGAFCPGMAITCNDIDSQDGDDDNSLEESSNHHLGYVISGGFSQSRGKFHGVGIISSRRFLELLKGGEHGRFLLVKRQNQTTVAVKVTTKYSDAESGTAITASLTILT